MSSVTINGHTYSDDSNASTGLAAGGHRTRFIPLIADVVTVAAEVESDRASASTSAGTATTQAGEASASAAAALTSEQNAQASEQAAALSEMNAAASEAAALVSEQNAQAISESGLPDQAGHNGDYLASNGVTTSWQTIAVPAAIPLFHFTNCI